MTMIEHLTELRRRLIIAFASVGLGAIIAWIFYPQIIEFLLEPYCRTLEAGEECQLYVRNPLEPFSVRLTVAGYGGIIVAMPMILWQFWAFVAPGLYSHEKRYALPFVWGGVALFFAGAGLAYWSIERALDFLSQVGGEDFTSLFAGRLPRLRDQDDRCVWGRVRVPDRPDLPADSGHPRLPHACQRPPVRHRWHRGPGGIHHAVR